MSLSTLDSAKLEQFVAALTPNSTLQHSSLDTPRFDKDGNRITDIHLLTAMDMTGKSYDKITPAERTRAKQQNYLGLYTNDKPIGGRS